VVSLFEKEAVARFLSEARGNISLAAQKAGITRRNFHRLLSKHSINTKKYKTES
jgi:DNA-binding NtrC family response regulator